MSVVNQMLRDLDRRQAGEESAVYTQHLRPVDARRRKPLIAIGSVILIAIAAIYAVLQYVDRPAPAAHPVEIAEAMQPAVTPIATEPAPVEAPAEQTTPIAEAAVDEPAATIIDEAASPVQSVATDELTAAAKSIAAPVVIKPALAASESDIAASSPIATPDSQAHSNAHTSPRHSRESDSARHSRESGNPGIAAPAAQTTLAVEPDTSATKIDVRPHAQPARSAESEFRRAAALINRARSEDARTALAAALELDARHEGARQTLAVLLIEAQAMDQAEALLAEGLKLNPKQSNFAIVLARLHLDRGDNAGALRVLNQYGAGAANNAEYRAFAAALLQRMNRHTEALAEYRAALTLTPNVGIWWIGLGLSFEAIDQPDKATEAFTRARATGTLSAEVAQFVEQKLQTAR